MAQVFREHGEAYRHKHVLSPAQYRAMRDIEVCRTEVLGGHVDVCLECGLRRPVFHSCRNRSCPKCQSLQQARWIAKRAERLLPTHHFHLVFTLPAELRALVYQNQETLYPLLFSAATQSLFEIGGDQKFLNAQLGISAVLHTWTRKLELHPHIHCIVTGGGLSLDGERWVASSEKFLFPVRVLSALFRGKFMAGLKRLIGQDELRLEGACAELRDPVLFAVFKDKLYRKNFNVYAEPPFGAAHHLVAYLGRYTHRVAISNERIIRIDEDGVCFATKDDNSITLTAEEFIRRFLLHVLPSGFVKVRHYGLYASANVNTKLETARQLLRLERRPAPAASRDDSEDEPEADERLVELPWWQLFLRLTGIDLGRCPRCHKRAMLRFEVPPSRGPP